MWPHPPEWATLILFMKFGFLHTCKEHSFSFQMIPKLCRSADRFKSYWWINLATVESSILRNWAEKIHFAYNSFTAVTIRNAWNCHKMPLLTIKSNVFEQKNALSTRFWRKPKINIFDLQIENRCTLYCGQVSMQLILGSRVTIALSLQNIYIYTTLIICTGLGHNLEVGEGELQC